MIEQAYNDFIHFMDSIFYEGYSRKLAAEHPQHFNYEFNQFIDNYYDKHNHNTETRHLGETQPIESNQRNSGTTC